MERRLGREIMLEENLKNVGLIEVFTHSVGPGSHFPAGSFQTFKLGR